MAQKLLALAEVHVEKVVLGLCALFMIYVAWGYLLKSPNKIELFGQKVGPGDLHEVIKQQADRLEQAVRNAKPEPVDVESYATKLRQTFEAGLFAQAEGKPPLRPVLPLATNFGSEIEIPGLEEEPPDSVELVTPLKPTPPVLEFGRSMVFRQPLVIGAAGAAAADEAETSNEPVELPWVTIAAEFDRKAQYTEMINAGYAPYRARVYIAGTEVRRQEMLSNGEFSDWKTIATTQAMPIVDIPEPVFDDEDGSLANKPEIDETFLTIKNNQQRIEQPPFYFVQAGDEWDIPPLPWRVEMMAKLAEAEAEPGATPGGAGGLRPGGGGLTPPSRGGLSPRGGGSSPRGGGLSPSPRGGGGTSPRSGGGSRLGGGGISPRGGLGGGFGGRPPSPADDRVALRRAIRDLLDKAREQYAAEDYAQAIQTAESVTNMEGATAVDKKKAKQILSAAQRKLEQAQRLAQSGGVPDRSAIQLEYVINPKTKAPAIWFHDDTVESGKTYRYSLRVKLWNRYVGQMRLVKNPEYAREPVIAGDWSVASDPITVTPSTYFFVGGPKPGSTSEAVVEVWKWLKGSWIKERFDVRVGDIIGGVKTVKTDELDAELKPVRTEVDFSTGAVVLDLRVDDPVMQRIKGKGDFNYREAKSLVLVYLDPADGQVKERSAALDRNSPLRKKLDEQSGF